MNNKAVGLLYGPEEPHLDHIATVCLFMQIPLFVTEKELERLAKKYYPSLQVIYEDYETVARRIASESEILFTCLPKTLVEQIFQFAEQSFGKKMHSIWCPHGQSDKGEGIPSIPGMSFEEMALFYGKKMLQWAQTKEPFTRLNAAISAGNFRLEFYTQEKAFYQGVLNKILKKNRPKTILYAPTWEESENKSSFFWATSPLIENLPKDTTLIIKPHPYLFENPLTESLIEQFHARPGVHFLREFPPIYPLLDICDLYIGDHSSIGYDWLSTKKPLFFLKGEEPKSSLMKCGVVVPKENVQEIYRLIEFYLPYDQEEFSEIRAQVYGETFETKNLESLRLEIMRSYHFLSEL